VKILAITQARISSSRLPGKSMKLINGKPMLHYHLNQLSQSKLIDEIAVATSLNKSDDKIANYCKKKKINFFRGSLKDVLSRYYFCAKKFKADLIVRITSDCPLIDPEIIDFCIKNYLKKKVDYLSNTNPPDGATYPDGTDVEIFNFKNLEYAFLKCKNKNFREHVTFYFWKNPIKFKIFRIDLKKNLRKYRITVDYKEDFLLINHILTYFKKNNIKLRLANIISFLNKKKYINRINSMHNKDLVILNEKM
jgi:spore coat polysaccharide biosynthesis protein SpsF